MKRFLGLLFILVIAGISANGNGDYAATQKQADKLPSFITPSVAQTVIPQELRGWYVEKSISPIDDGPVVVAWHHSVDPVEDRFGRETWPTLNLVCRENKTHLYLDVKGFFFSDHESWGDVVVRHSKSKARTFEMANSTDNQAIGLWSGRGISVAKEMMKHEFTLWKVTPYNETPETISFNLLGFKDAAMEVSKACKWN